ncbi:DUF6913 domain-containing protein [Abyssalbus ytuae]|uniref:Uncharacterized protein n=1 Tax=Abyssalbus ytuae TaxID=2926907 RepID=A0A9E7CU55_9FLAO|nr:hypothetical protein [Abyssalbus ytuae]UOB17682.1 hypothetical protein MQE35_18315 [Abyssalbus ytuae]
MILKTIKEKTLNTIIKKKLREKGNESYLHWSNPPCALFLVNYEILKDIKQIYSLAEGLNIEEEEFKIIGYVEKINKAEYYPIPVFSENSVLVNGHINNFKVNHYLTKHYDLVINYYEKNILPLRLINSLAKTNFRVGLGHKNTEFNDLTITGTSENNDFEYFKKELIKYLTILNKK